MAHDVFISYSSHDKPVADAVCATLENRGIRCWIAPRDIAPGADWAAEIIDAINASQVMVLLYSGRSNESPQVKREVERAVNRGVSLIPFRIENVPMSKSLEYFISTPHWLDALTEPMQQHLDRLADAISLLLDRPSVEQANPPGGHARSTTPAPLPPMTSSKALLEGIGRWAAETTTPRTLAQIFVSPSDRMANAALVLGAVILITIFAQFRFGPIWLQPVGVVLGAAVLGSQRAGLMVIIYIALGIAGLPVFGVGRSAWTDLPSRAPYAQHALGYLVGLVVAAFVVGWLAERRSWDQRVPTAALLGVIGVLILYVPGLLWAEGVAMFLREFRSQAALVLPSIPMLVITVGIVTVALPQAWSRLGRQNSAARAEPTPLGTESAS